MWHINLHPVLPHNFLKESDAFGKRLWLLTNPRGQEEERKMDVDRRCGGVSGGPALRLEGWRASWEPEGGSEQCWVFGDSGGGESDLQVSSEELCRGLSGSPLTLGRLHKADTHKRRRKRSHLVARTRYTLTHGHTCGQADRSHRFSCTRSSLLNKTWHRGACIYFPCICTVCL